MGFVARRSGLVLASLVLMTACSSSGAPAPSSSQSAQAGGPGIAVRVRVGGDWTALDPFILQGGEAGPAIDSATYDRLVTLDNGKIIPYIATSWTQTPTSITFKLRGDVVCAGPDLKTTGAQAIARGRSPSGAL